MAATKDWLVGGGEMASVIKAKDWSRTPLGAIETWPQSLRTTVSLAQASNSPISLAWGAGHVQIYNDGYWPICGEKHPESMGQDFRACWASAFPVIGEAYETAWSGKSAYLEKMRMFLDRFGFLEETWFTFSFSPITDESGGVGGLFNPVTEMTGQMLSERRTRTLRDLAARTSKAKTSRDAFAISTEVLAESALDVPFVLFYSIDEQGHEAHLIGRSGLPPGTPASPERFDLRQPDDGPWSIGAVARTGIAQTIDDPAARLTGVAVGPYPELPRKAFALPIALPGSHRPTAVMVAGASARLPMTESYRAFYDIAAASVASALANAFAYEAEIQRSEALAEIDRAKTAFFSNVSHEFRTPLTLILGPLEDELSERDDPLPPPRRHRLETAHHNSLRLLKLVNALLDFSRIEAGRMQASYEPTDLAGETAELASVFRSAFEKAGLSMTVNCQPLPEPIYVDREMWEKIVLNLLSNAFKHTFEGGVEVRLAWRGDHAELVVFDSGVGISPSELPRLFERFHRVRGARSRSHEGAGIGLALVQDLVRLHGGTVHAESIEGVGTRFVVTIKAGRDHLPPGWAEGPAGSPVTRSLPALELAEALRWLPQASAGPPGGGDERIDAAGTPGKGRRVAPEASGGRIVWADDNADMRDYVHRLLEEHYDVMSVPDGAAALAAAREHAPDLVLSDVMMPGLDGFALLRELRRDPATRSIPVILLSARAGEESAIEGLDAGADDYLVKPFSARELYARVRTHLELGRMRRGWARQLERAVRELEAFSYSVSHDLRAPLRTVTGFTQILLDDHGAELGAAPRRHLERISAAAARMQSMIESLLHLSRIGRGELERTSIDLSELAGQIVAELRARDPLRSVAVEIAPGLHARGDARLLPPLLENLVGNAWKFTASRPDGRIEIGRGLEGGPDAYFVRDNGAGFDMAHAGKMFAPFQRLHSGSEFEGAGIGLATVHRIVSRHGGRVWAEAVVNQGATFYFTLDGEG